MKVSKQIIVFDFFVRLSSGVRPASGTEQHLARPALRRRLARDERARAEVVARRRPGLAHHGLHHEGGGGSGGR